MPAAQRTTNTTSCPYQGSLLSERLATLASRLDRRRCAVDTGHLEDTANRELNQIGHALVVPAHHFAVEDLDRLAEVGRSLEIAAEVGQGGRGGGGAFA